VKCIFPKPGRPRRERKTFHLIFCSEDASLLVLNKRPGVVVHPAAGHEEHTLVNALLHHCAAASAALWSGGPGIVHRLDKTPAASRRGQER